MASNLGQSCDTDLRMIGHRQNCPLFGSVHFWSFILYERPILDDEPKPNFAAKKVGHEISHMKSAEFHEIICISHEIEEISLKKWSQKRCGVPK